MSDEDYVIKSKPVHITLEDHVQQLRNSIMSDDRDFDNISICSDDFIVDDEDFIIDDADLDVNTKENNDNNANVGENVIEISNTQDFNINVEHFSTFASKDNDIEVSDKIADQNEIYDIDMIDTQDLNDSITILKDFDHGNVLDEVNTVTQDRNSLNDVTAILSGLDDNMVMIEKVNDENSLTRFSDTRCVTDNDATQCESLNISANVVENALSQSCIYSLSDENKKPKLKSTPNITKRNKKTNKCEDLKNTNSKSIITDNAKCSNTQFSDTQCVTDNDATLCESFNISANVVENALSQTYCYSLSDKNKKPKLKSNSNVTKKKRVTTKMSKKSNKCKDLKNTNTKSIITDNEKCYNSLSNIGTTSKNDYKENDSNLKLISNITSTENIANNLKAYRHTKTFNNVYYNVAGMFENNKNKNSEELKKNLTGTNLNSVKKLCIYNDAPNNSQDVKHNITNDFSCVTHYSSSQTNDIIPIDDRYIHGTKDKRHTHIQNQDDVNDSNKVNKENTITLQTDIINISKHVTEIEELRDNVIFPQEIQLSTQKLNSSNQKIIINYDNVAEANDIAMKESQPINNITSMSNSQMLSQNKEDALDIIQDNSAIFNPLSENSKTKSKEDTLNAVECATYTNNAITDVDESMLFIDDILLNTDKSMLNARNAQTNDNRLLRNDSLVICNSSLETVDGTILFENESNINTKVGNDILSEESQFTDLCYSTDAFKNYNADDSLGLSQFSDIGTMNYEIANENSNEIECTSVGNYTNVSNSLTDHFRNNFENPQNSQNVKNKYDGNGENSNNAGKIEIQNFSINGVNDHFEEVRCDDPKNKPTEGFIISDDGLNEHTDSEVEKIPFKIIEELKKVKMFLNKKQDKSFSAMGYSSDAGYRSDSSSRHSLTFSVSQSHNRMDQTAHTLFNYMIHCPLVAATQDIIEEISLVLGQLIDKSHDEERCPSYLEEMLQLIKQMLKNIYEDTDDENMLSKKDDTLHRIILMSKSTHIQKYTVEKITRILEDLNTELTTDENFELQNIGKVENVCYIFNLLEIILRKHNKSGLNLSQDTQSFSQSTQEEHTLLKKIYIVDIWRRKWNPNHKAFKNEGSQEKKCVINDCNRVLNKLIVGCMEGYSLISYYALKCFNVMQT